MRENKQILYMQALTTQKVHYRVYLKSLYTEIIFELSVCKVLYYYTVQYMDSAHTVFTAVLTPVNK
jgi:hypothetical protein